MDELIGVMSDILDELREMNQTLNEIKGSGLYNSMSDVCDKLEDVVSAVYDTNI